jgi:hypothetical protein
MQHKLWGIVCKLLTVTLLKSLRESAPVARFRSLSVIPKMESPWDNIQLCNFIDLGKETHGRFQQGPAAASY